MTKWFDTNYHYIVPELGPDTSSRSRPAKPFDEHAEAMEELGIDTVPVLVGPVTFLLLGKSADGVAEDFDRLSLLEPLLEVYGEVIERLAEQGATWVQLDEPCFVEDRSERELDALRLAYEELARVHERTADLLVKTYFDHVGDAYGVLRDLPIEGIGLDLHREGADVAGSHGARGAPERRADRRTRAASRTSGCSPGSSTAATSGSTTSSTASTCSSGLRDRCDELVVSTSCSLLHTPVDLDAEPAVGRASTTSCAPGWRSRSRRSARSRPWLAASARGARRSPPSSTPTTGRSRTGGTPSAPATPAVRERVEALSEEDARRDSPFEVRREAQRARLGLPLFPTTTIGSYPQTAEIRKARAALRRGQDRRGRVRGPDAVRDRARDRLPGGGRPRRARPRRAGAQRHGPVLRRADGGLRLHPERLGAVIRLALRAPADPLRRRPPARADDRRVDRLRPVAHRASR